MSASPASRRRTAKSGSRRGDATSEEPELSLARQVTADEDGIHVTFEDGRVLGVPLTRRLKAATPEQRRAGYVTGFGTWLRWEEIDEDIGVDSVLGVDEDEFLEFAGFTTGMPEK